MKKWRILCIFACFCVILTCAGCGDKALPSANIVRDDARVGGSLSFVYDKDERVITIGGKDEVLQFSSADEERGLGKGNRFGIKVIAPDEKLDLESATLKMNDQTYSSGTFLEEISGQKQRFFNLYPLFTEKDREVCFTICWQDGTEKQEYKIVVAPGTKFMNENGEISK